MKKEKDRPLTQAEQRRLATFQEVRQKLESEGYRMKELTVGVVAANVLALVTTLPICALFVWLFLRHGYSFRFGGSALPSVLLFFAVFIALIFVHEGLHGLTFGFFAPGHYKSIEFGFIKEYLTPYCTCREALKKGEYILGTMMPMLVLGILPSLIGALAGSLFLLGIGLMMILGAGGDFTIFLKILFQGSNARDALYFDHPTKVGLAVFER